MKNLTDAYQQLVTTGARNSYQFGLTIITGISVIDAVLGENIQIWADGTTLPGRTQNTVPLPYLGYTFQHPTNFTMTNNITFNVRADQPMLIRDALFAWQSYFSDPDVGGGSFGGGDKRVPGNSKIIIDLYDYQVVNIEHTYNLIGAIPTNVGNITMSHNSTGIATFSVSVAYQFWNSESKNSSLFGAAT